MAYAAVTSLMETLHLNFLQSQPRFPLDENEGWTKRIIKSCLHGIFNQALKQTYYLKKKLIRSEEQQLAESSSSSQNACDSIPLMTSPLQVKKKMVSLHENLGLLQDILQKSENIANEAEIRDVLLKVEERIEMELTTFYLSDSLCKRDCLIGLHRIIIEAEKQTYGLKDKLSNSSECQQLAKVSSQNETVSLIAWMRQRGLQLVKGLSLPNVVYNNFIVSKYFKNSSKSVSRMVGCDKEFKTIMDQLTRQSDKKLQVVSIVGMGGIGKTALARKVYEDPSITSHFDRQAWVTVSQQHSKEQMLRCLIGGVSEASRDEPSTDQLAECLRRCLIGQRYLIVMDDIWSTTTWDSVQTCFPHDDDNTGSHILLTSQLEKVAKYPSLDNYIINMPLLDTDDSWSLFCSVFGKTEFSSKFDKIGRKIVKKSNGLPLAITVVASLLSKTEKDKEKWQNVAKRLTDDSNEVCSRILNYKKLPHNLKVCFLYFGIFEEDYEIPVKKLVRLWAAEGFLKAAKKRENMEEVGMKCLKKLVDRSLVIVTKQSYNGEMKRVRIHNLLRDLCLREAKRENLLSDTKPENLLNFQWISITSRSFHNKVRFEDECSHKPHSFHCTHLYYYTEYADVERLFLHLKLLRVVDIRGRFFYGGMALNMLSKLVHLRYLGLSTYETFEIKLFEHWNMQSFIVTGNGVILDTSEANKLWKMPLLRNFCIGRIFSLEAPSADYRNLENISWLDSKLCTKDLFTRIPNLKKLGIDGGCYDNNLDCFYTFVQLGKKLEKLSIRRWYDLKLPRSGISWATSFLQNLKKLNLLESNLPWSDLSLISMLPKLEVLKLINACQGPMWEPSDGGFCELKRLVIEKTSLQYWNAVGDNFPMLQCLEISDCYLLEEIPSSFAEIIALKLIQLSKCRDSLVASAKLIRKGHKNIFGNDALHVRSKNIRLKNCGEMFEEEEISVE